MNQILSLIGDWWWLAPLAGAGLVAYKFLGWRGLLAVATFGLAGGLYTRGRTDERDRLERLDAAERSEAIEDRREVDEQVRKDGPDAARDYLRDRVQPHKPR
jgi:hypothetical protein